MLLLVCIAGSTQAQSRADERALRQRGTDSAWIFMRPFAANRFYLGTKRVTPLEFHNTLRSSDRDVAHLIDQSFRQRRTALIIAGGGAVMSLTGLALLNRAPFGEIPTTSMVLIIGASVMEIAAEIINLSAVNRYREGIRLFNNKYRSTALHTNPQLSISTTQHGIGFVLKF